MIKVMIADDEYLIRDGLKNAVDWASHDMEVVATAESGEEGVALAREFRPDLVITDICMPFGDGLEMSRIILEERPDTTIIVLTCYEEFDYAKTALKLGAFDYILKPMDLDDFDSVLCRVQEKYTAHVQERIGVCERLADIVHGRAQTQGAELPEINENAFYGCVLFRLLGFEYAQGVFSSQEIQNYLKGFQDMVGECAGAAVMQENQLDEGRILIVCAAYDQVETQRQMDMMLRAVQSTSQLKDDYPLLCAVSEVRRGVETLPELYGQCKSVIRTAYLCDDTRIINYADFSRQMDETEDISASVEAFANCMRTFDKHAVAEMLQEIYGNLQRGGHNSMMFSRLFVTSVMLELVKVAKEVNVDFEGMYGSFTEYYKRVLMESSLGSQIQKITDIAQEVCDAVHAKRMNPHMEVIRQAQKYIDENYTRGDLTLQSTAQAVHMSPSYFSIVFKQTVGRSFISYLTDLRMEQSKYLLQHTSRRVYEIGYAVGYDNPTYFSTLFKRCYGIGPTEYRMRLAEQESSKKYRRDEKNS